MNSDNTKKHIKLCKSAIETNLMAVAQDILQSTDARRSLVLRVPRSSNVEFYTIEKHLMAPRDVILEHDDYLQVCLGTFPAPPTDPGMHAKLQWLSTVTVGAYDVLLQLEPAILELLNPDIPPTLVVAEAEDGASVMVQLDGDIADYDIDVTTNSSSRVTLRVNRRLSTPVNTPEKDAAISTEDTESTDEVLKGSPGASPVPEEAAHFAVSVLNPILAATNHRTKEAGEEEYDWDVLAELAGQSTIASVGDATWPHRTVYVSEEYQKLARESNTLAGAAFPFGVDRKTILKLDMESFPMTELHNVGLHPENFETIVSDPTGKFTDEPHHAPPRQGEYYIGGKPMRESHTWCDKMSVVVSCVLARTGKVVPMRTKMRSGDEGLTVFHTSAAFLPYVDMVMNTCRPRLTSLGVGEVLKSTGLVSGLGAAVAVSERRFTELRGNDDLLTYLLGEAEGAAPGCNCDELHVLLLDAGLVTRTLHEGIVRVQVTELGAYLSRNNPQTVVPLLQLVDVQARF